MLFIFFLSLFLLLAGAQHLHIYFFPF